MIKKRVPKVITILIILFCILWSGGAATYSLWNMWPVYVLVINLFLISQYKVNISNSAWRVLLFLHFLTLVQMLVHHGDTTTLIHHMLIVTNVFFFAFLVADSFPKYFVQIVTAFAIISLPFYILDNFGFHSQLLSISNILPQAGVENMHEIDRQSSLHTLYLYNISDSDFSVLNLRRNSGPFWEPGRFTIFLNIALLINLFYYRMPLLSKPNVFLLAANITAMSTTGIIVLILILLVYVLKGNAPKGTKAFWAILLIVSIPSLLSLEFMTDKIGEELANDETYSRFGAIGYHITQINQSPLLGFGPFLGSVFRFDLSMSPNGLSDSVRFFGIPTALYTWYLLYKGTKVYILLGDFEKIAACVAILLLAFTQNITMSPFYYMLYFFASTPVNNQLKYV